MQSNPVGESAAAAAAAASQQSASLAQQFSTQCTDYADFYENAGRTWNAFAQDPQYPASES